MKKFGILLVMILLVAAPIILNTHLVHADFDPNLTKQACDTAKGDICGQGAIDPNDLLRKITTIVAIIVGIASVISIIIGGIMFATSNGDSSRTVRARSLIIYSLVGLVVSAMAGTIADYILIHIK